MIAKNTHGVYGMLLRSGNEPVRVGADCRLCATINTHSRIESTVKDLSICQTKKKSQETSK